MIYTNFMIYVEIAKCHFKGIFNFWWSTILMVLAADNCVLDFSLHVLDTVSVIEDKRPCAEVACASVGDGNFMCSVYSSVKCCIFQPYRCTSYITTATRGIKLWLDMELHLVFV
jgi:hypothetical protein